MRIRIKLAGRDYIFMLIGIDASRANREHKSGTEWYSYYLIRALAKLDKDNQYILYSDIPLKGGMADLREGKVAGEPEYDKRGYQIVQSPHNNFKAKVLKWPFSSFWTLGRLSLEMLFNKPDILFVPAHSLPLIIPKRTVVTIHDIAFKIEREVYEKEQMGTSKIAGKKIADIIARIATKNKYGANSRDYLDWSTKHCFKKANKIITVSEFTKKEIERIYGKADIEVIHNGCSPLYCKEENMEKDKKDEVLDKYGIPNSFILNVGRLEKKKNTPMLIEAFAKAKYLNKDIKEKLVLIGDASYGYDDVKYMIEEFALNEDVIMPGWVREEDMPYIFSSATAFIFPTRHEGFGMPVVQAMACGLPVACSDIPVLREIAGSAALFFDRHDKDGVAKAIERVISDEELRRGLEKKGYEQASKYSWDICASKTLKIINDLRDND